jgi:hypothetical protein
MQMKRGAQIQHEAVVVGRWYHHLAEARPQMYYADILPGEVITGPYNGLRMQDFDIVAWM